jgi:hypothetical protein
MLKSGELVFLDMVQRSISRWYSTRRTFLCMHICLGISVTVLHTMSDIIMTSHV